MAALHALPAGQVAGQGRPLGVATAGTAEGEHVGESTQALVPAPAVQQDEAPSAFPAPVLRLPVELAVGIPVRDFRVRHLLALAPGQVIETRWNHGDDVPLASGDVQVAWSEFEVVRTRLAVRITRLE
jgi:flagellar motor switch protein FliM